jgi:hypothetical protein
VSEDQLSRKDFWQMKKEELIDYLDKHDIPYDPDKFDRKSAIERLVQLEAESGDLKSPVELNEEGEAGAPNISNKYVDIVFHDQEGFPKYVFLGLNGRFLFLPRECVCRIPEEFMEVVQHAVSKTMVKTELKGRTTYREVKVPRLSYEVLERGVI